MAGQTLRHMLRSPRRTIEAVSRGTGIARTRSDQKGLNSIGVEAIATGFILFVERFDAAVFAQFHHDAQRKGR